MALSSARRSALSSPQSVVSSQRVPSLKICNVLAPRRAGLRRSGRPETRAQRHSAGGDDVGWLQEVASNRGQTTGEEKARGALSCEKLALPRRSLLGLALPAIVAWPPAPAHAAAAAGKDEIEELALQAIQAYRARELPRALDLFNSIVQLDSQNSVWYERRGQVLVDLDRFPAAIADFNRAQSMQADSYVSLGLLSNRALAYEGLSDWEAAEKDYSTCLALSKELGLTGPYILNARGNARASLGRWAEAREDYTQAAEVFQRNRNLQGTIFAAANAGLVQMQLGNEADAVKEIEAVARRAPGSVDMRAALAAIYWSNGQETRAEETWRQACDMINSGQLREGGSVYDGCEKYKDMDWLRRIRRWPPVMVEKMSDFVGLRSPLASGGTSR
mmetsp:Transcript_21408/g.53919  ORF Transcript_21408/g.53919 Transcript_21408/m.53919 type:complete len:390 (-) Transcript_21408:79-1248(-)